MYKHYNEGYMILKSHFYKI